MNSANPNQRPWKERGFTKLYSMYMRLKVAEILEDYSDFAIVMPWKWVTFEHFFGPRVESPVKHDKTHLPATDCET